MWFDEFNSVFFTGIGTMAFGFLALLIRYAFLSKCDNVSICFGLLNIHRAVELENIEGGNLKEGDQKGESKEEI